MRQLNNEITARRKVKFYAFTLVQADGVEFHNSRKAQMEHLAQIRCGRILAGDEEPGTARYDLGGEGSDTGMVCGGTVTLCFLSVTSALLPALRSLSAWLEAGSPCWLSLALEGDSPALQVYDGETPPPALEGRPIDRPLLQNGLYSEPMGRDGVLYLFGAGHVGRALAPLLAQVDFRVVVFDSRPEALDPHFFPGVQQVVQGSFSQISDAVSVTPRDYVVVMTPGHGADLEVLCQVMACCPRYVGCMGSRKKLAFIREHLAKRGFSQKEIESLHLPIGLSIQAETPKEIAVSVAAELIAFRAQALHGPKGTSCPA